MLLRNKIIVLKKWPFSESDLIIRGLNPQGCQMSFIAKGALKSKKRFSGGLLDPTAYIEIEYKASKNYLHKLQNAWFIEDFYKLRTEYHRLNLALYFVKIMGILSQEGCEDSKELFNLLGNALKETEKTPFLNSLKVFFQMKILFIQGVLPQELKHSQILQTTLKNHKHFKMSEEHKHALSHKLEKALNHYISS